MNKTNLTHTGFNWSQSKFILLIFSLLLPAMEIFSSTPSFAPANRFSTFELSETEIDDGGFANPMVPIINCPNDVVVTLGPGECSAIVTFTVTATNNGAPVTTTQTGNTSLGNGSAFPIGTHTLTFSTTGLGANNVSCSFNVTVNEFPNPTGTLTCNNFVQASIPSSGIAIIGADMVLEGGPYGCYNDYTVEIFAGAGISIGNTLNCSNIGTTYTVKVTDPDTGNTCWGQIIAEDKLPPVINCLPRVVPCTQDVNLVPKPTLTDNCDATPTLNLVELVLIDDDVCDNGQVQFRRVWIAFDDYGNTSQPCQEIITVTRPNVVDFPEDVTWQCGQYAAFPGIVAATRLHPSIVDTDLSDDDIDVSPGLANAILANTGSGIPGNIDGEFCGYGYFHSDEIVSVCDGAPGVLKIIRTWVVLDWCTGQVITTGVGGEDNIQVIKVVDTIAPVIPPVDTVIVNANVAGVHPQPCRSTELIPVPAIFDNCSGVKEVHVFTPIGEAFGGVIPSPGLPLGYHIITLTATDYCGNFASRTFILRVVDEIAPVAVCDQITDVNLSSDGFAEVFAETFDDGSHDNCCIDKFEVRRMTDPCDDGHNDIVFGTSVKFCCNDIGTNPAMVVFRVYDCFGNTNDCMVQVTVADKIPPVLVSCPANTRITCDKYASELQTALFPQMSLTGAQQCAVLTQAGYGEPVYTDNCSPIVTCNAVPTIDLCLEGTIVRTWTVKDAAGNNGQNCTQTIWVDHVSDWAVVFPADKEFECTAGVSSSQLDSIFGVPQIFNETCELVGVSYTDEVFNTVPDACYKVLRTWTVINWCVVGTQIDQEVVELSEAQLWNQGVTTLADRDINGDGIFNPAEINSNISHRTYRDSWNNTPGKKKKPTAADNPTGNMPHSTSITDPDTDPDSDPWDGYITFQQTIKVKDILPPKFVNGCLQPDVLITDTTCVGTIVLNQPEIMDCSPSVTVTAQVNIGGVWVSGNGPIANVAPGTYQVRFNAMDQCNNQQDCFTTIKIKDAKKPTPYCKNGVVVNLMSHPNGPMIVVWASDLNDGSFDNCTSNGNLIFSFSQDTTETSVIFGCNKVGFNLVNIWVTDEAGNQDFCSTSIIVHDNGAICPIPLVMGGSITNENEQGIQDVEVRLGGTSNSMAMTTADGMYQFDNIVWGGDYTILPLKDTHPLNGVTTFDLVLISKHILGTQLLDSPFKIIAADANNSKSVTTFDLVELRKLILFIYDELPNNTSWRFVRKNFFFPNPANPWQTQFPELVNINDVEANHLNVNFRGIKVGDVNGSASPSQLISSNEDRSTGGTFTFKTKDVFVKKGDTFTVPFSVKDREAIGFQFTLSFDSDKLRFVATTPGLISEESFGLALLEKGAVTASWNRNDGNAQRFDGEVFGLTFQAKSDGKLSDLLQIHSRFTQAEAYNADLELMKVDLKFENQTPGTGFVLYQNVPNPFNDGTLIGFHLPEAAHVTLTVMDIAGRVVKVWNNEYPQGYNELKIERGELDAGGVLYYRLQTKDYTATRKMILVD